MTKDVVKKPKRKGTLRNERPKEVLLIRVKQFSKVADSKDCSKILYFIRESHIGESRQASSSSGTS